MTAQKRLTDEFKSNADPEMTVKFTDIDGNEMEVEYYSYDTNLLCRCYKQKSIFALIFYIFKVQKHIITQFPYKRPQLIIGRPCTFILLFVVLNL